MYQIRTENTCARPKGIGFLLLVLAIGLLGCTPTTPNSNTAPPVSNSNLTATNSTSNSNSNSTSEASASNVPITLPVVDALLSDDEFVSEVKKTVQPSDEQLDKLKNAARDAVLKLNEDAGSDEYTRSTKSAISEAEKEIKEVLGSENGAKFLNLARKHWSGGDVAALAKPNEVPADTRIVVNAPAYRMDVFQDGKIVKSYKVGIGYPEFPLPTGLRTAKKIIFNPAWTPPDEPWVKGKFEPGKKVEAGSKDNPLGPIKIPIGLPSLIHGGKDPSRLGTFASHGCVGLTNALVQDFTAELTKLSGSPLTSQQIKAYEQKRSETSEVNLTNPIPVELRYETIVADDGKLHVYRDVYEHGTNTEENLERVLQAYGLSTKDLSPDEQTKVREALKRMAIDAHGQPVDEGDSNKKPSNSAKVTKTMKGAKEVVVDVAALKGKGYPAPVNINL